MTYDEAVDYIENIPRFSTTNDDVMMGQRPRGKSGNTNLCAVMELLGNPEKINKAIHIAGTNGKGSTATFVANFLRERGYSVGVFTSPHLLKVNERISIDMQDISDDEFLECFIKVKEAISINEENGGCGLSFFEYVFAIAAVYFGEKKPDFVVYETGLGGRLDATNIVTPVICGITSIGLDHTKYLGDTIQQIAYEKAGIIKPGVPVVYNTGDVLADDVIAGKTDECGSCQINVAKTDYMINDFEDNGIDFSVINSYYNYHNMKLDKDTALYQVDNATTAIVMCNKLLEIQGQAYLSCKEIQHGLDSFYWPGRMERLSDRVVVDGAHNTDAVNRFIDTVRSRESGEICLLFAVAGDKDYELMIEALCNNLVIGFVCVTTLDSNRGISADYIAKIFDYYLKKSDVISDNMCEIIAVDNIEEALCISEDEAIKRDCTLYCVGSLYLIGSIKELRRNTR